jgi:Tol biopolymer transport system component
MEPHGEARRLTSHNRWSVHPVWSRDGRNILYVFGEDTGDTQREIRIIDASGVPKSGLAAPLQNDLFWEVSVGRHLVYSRETHDQNIWRATIPGPNDPPAVPELFMPSTRLDGMPKYSPDGKKIAFGSSRSGSHEIWVANGDGSNPVQMTFFGGPLVGYMNWSPDGQWIVFHARPEGQADLFVSPAAGGPPKRLTRDPADETLPSYSHDGLWIYFDSRRTGQGQIWRMPAAGGDATQITTSGGTMAIESPNGKELFYLQWVGVNDRAIWKVQVQGGKPVRVTGPIHASPCAFAVTADGIYYTAPPHSGDQRFIRFYSFSSGQSRPIVLTNRPFGIGMSIARHGRQIVFDQHDDVGRDLVLIKNFRLQ